ncbi:MAG: glycosyl hydrolase, partial [Roseimicrobium sp.]
ALSMRVTGRGAASDGPAQQTNVLSNLTNGATYVTRFKIKLDSPAQVRCLMFVTSSISQTPLILAETVVRTAQVGQWVSLEGVQTVGWTGSASAARMYFAVEQIFPNGATAPAGSYPSYNLDDVTMDLDNDGDGMSNTEEATAVTNPNLKDSDGDTMSDPWEIAALLNPNDPADAALDADGDGHSNAIEYWANTNLRDAASYPGITTDPLASNATRSLLYYLQTRGARKTGKRLSGQHAQDIASGDYSTFVAGLNTLMTTAGYPSWVSVLGIAADGPSAEMPMQIQNSGPVGRAYMDAGGLVVLHFSPRNPWNLGFQGDHTSVNIANLLTPGTVANTRMIGWMDSLAAELALFGPNRPVIFRPFSEANGGWNWFGKLSQSEFIAMYRWFHDYFVNTKGLHNIIWTIEAHIGAHQSSGVNSAGVSMDYYWPGDDVIDLIGFSSYVHNWVPGFDADAISRLHPKAFAITEGGMPPTEDDVPNNYNSLYLNALDSYYPRSAFFIIWNSFPGGSYISIKDNPNYLTLLTDPRVTNREAANYLNTTAYWQIANGLLNKPLAGDTDRDGICDVIEAALGLNPLAPSNISMPTHSFSSVNSQSYSTITFTRDTSIFDLTTTVQWSNDLLNWSNGSSYGPAGIVSNNAITTEVSRTLNGSIETITVRSNTASKVGPQFMRVSVTGP